MRWAESVIRMIGIRCKSEGEKIIGKPGGNVGVQVRRLHCNRAVREWRGHWIVSEWHCRDGCAGITWANRNFREGILSVELVRPQLVCPCQRYPPLDIGRIHCEKYAIFFISTPINIKVALTVRCVFVVLQFSGRPCDIPKSHLQVVLTKGKGEAGTITGFRLCGKFSSFLVVLFYLSNVKKEPFWLSPSHSETRSKSSCNEIQRDALFLIFIWQSTLHVSETSAVHHQKYLKTVYTQ